MALKIEIEYSLARHWTVEFQRMLLGRSSTVRARMRNRVAFTSLKDWKILTIVERILCSLSDSSGERFCVTVTSPS